MQEETAALVATIKRAETVMKLQAALLNTALTAMNAYVDVIKRQDAKIRCLEIELMDERGGK